MTMTERAIGELRLAGLYDPDSDYGGHIGVAVEELLKCFQSQGHSGFSAMMVADIFHRLIRGECLTPLTGSEDEWGDGMDGIRQNRRCFRVFMDRDGKSWDMEAVVFEDSDGNRWTGPLSRAEVTFPYLPISKVVLSTKNEKGETNEKEGEAGNAVFNW